MKQYHICYYISDCLCTGITIEASSIRDALRKVGTSINNIIYIHAKDQSYEGWVHPIVRRCRKIPQTNQEAYASKWMAVQECSKQKTSQRINEATSPIHWWRDTWRHNQVKGWRNKVIQWVQVYICKRCKITPMIPIAILVVIILLLRADLIYSTLSAIILFPITLFCCAWAFFNLLKLFYEWKK